MDGSRPLAGEEAKWSSEIGPARQLDGPTGQEEAARLGIAAVDDQGTEMGSQRMVRRCGTVRCGAVAARYTRVHLPRSIYEKIANATAMRGVFIS